MGARTAVEVAATDQLPWVSVHIVIGAASGQGHDEDDSRRYQERNLGKLANLINPP